MMKEVKGFIMQVLVLGIFVMATFLLIEYSSIYKNAYQQLEYNISHSSIGVWRNMEEGGEG